MVSITCYQAREEGITKKFVFKKGIGSYQVENIDLDKQCLKLNWLLSVIVEGVSIIKLKRRPSLFLN